MKRVATHLRPKTTVVFVHFALWLMRGGTFDTFEIDFTARRGLHVSGN